MIIFSTRSSMRDRQRILRNLIALVSLGKAGVIGAGLLLALVGYADIARRVLPSDLFAYVSGGFPLEAIASVGGLLGIVVGLIVSLLR